LKLTSLNVEHTDSVIDHESNSFTMTITMANDMNIMLISKCNGDNCHV